LIEHTDCRDNRVDTFTTFVKRIANFDVFFMRGIADFASGFGILVIVVITAPNIRTVAANFIGMFNMSATAKRQCFLGTPTTR
jgi:hypothetical protein